MAGSSEAGAGRRDRLSWLASPRTLTVTAGRLTWALVALGVVLRLVAFAGNRPLYRDERSLLENLVRLPVLDFRTTLTEYQLAPPGFLAIERMLVRLPGSDVTAARSFPLACGVAAMLLFPAVARRFVRPFAVPIAGGLFAMSDWLIYYSTEMKQYSCDLVLTLAALRIAAGPPPPSVRRMLVLGAFGAFGVWFSYPLAFVLAGVGTYLFAMAILRRDRHEAAGLSAVGLTWAASFAACYVISHGMLDQGRFIWDWWDFAFLRIPPHSMAELKLEVCQLLNVFDSPADVKTPLGPLVSTILGLALATAGAVAMGRSRPGGLYLLAAPVVAVLASSAMRQYPFHGRLLIFLVPSLHLLVGEGAAALSRPGGPRLALALGAFLLLQPGYDALSHLDRPMNHDGFDSHGDLRPDLLDELGAEKLDTGRSKR